MTSSRSLGAVLRQARQRKELTQAAAAQLIGVSANTISRWEHDRLIPEDRNLQRAFAVYELEHSVGAAGEVEELRARVATIEQTLRELQAGRTGAPADV